MNTLDKPFNIQEFYTRYRNEELIKYLPYRSQLVVLDCGCGRGVLLDQLSGRTRAAWGIDSSLDDPKHTYLPDHIVAADPARLPFSDRVFDAVIGQQVLSLPAPRSVLRELARMLRPGGKLVLWESRASYCMTSHMDLENELRSFDLVPVLQEPSDYLAYPASKLIDQVPSFAQLNILSVALKALFAADGILARLSMTKDWSWHLILVAEKRE